MEAKFSGGPLDGLQLGPDKINAVAIVVALKTETTLSTALNTYTATVDSTKHRRPRRAFRRRNNQGPHRHRASLCGIVPAAARPSKARTPEIRKLRHD